MGAWVVAAPTSVELLWNLRACVERGGWITAASAQPPPHTRLALACVFLAWNNVVVSSLPPLPPPSVAHLLRRLPCSRPGLPARTALSPSHMPTYLAAFEMGLTSVRHWSLASSLVSRFGLYAPRTCLQPPTTCRRLPSPFLHCIACRHPQPPLHVRFPCSPPLALTIKHLPCPHTQFRQDESWAQARERQADEDEEEEEEGKGGTGGGLHESMSHVQVMAWLRRSFPLKSHNLLI